MEFGHVEARNYPLGMVWDEAALVISREQRREATRALLIQSAVSSLLDKKAAKNFGKVVKDLMD